jgi:hypothetical protein
VLDKDCSLCLLVIIVLPTLFIDDNEDDEELIVGIVRFNIFISCNHERFVKLSSKVFDVVVEIRDGVLVLCVVKTCVVSVDLFIGLFWDVNV